MFGDACLGGGAKLTSTALHYTTCRTSRSFWVEMAGGGFQCSTLLLMMLLGDCSTTLSGHSLRLS